MENTTEFLLRRASEESLKAIAADRPEVADAHNELAIRYSSKAMVALANGDEPTEVAPTTQSARNNNDKSART